MKIDEVTKKYLELRTLKASLEALYKQKRAPLLAELELIENNMLAFLNESGQESAKTKYGTVYKSTLSNVTIKDGVKLYEFIKENDALDLLQRKVTKSVYEQYVKDGIDVPGVAVSSKVSINVRKQ